VVSRKEIESFDARVLGSGEFVEELWRKEETKGQVRRVVSLPALVGQVALLLDLEEEEIRRPSKKRWLAEARGIIVYLAVRELGYRAYEVGKELRLGAAGVSISLRRTEVLFRNQPDLKNKIFRLLEK
jgi:chromosomal replication initiation ATPase DnaA